MKKPIIMVLTLVAAWSVAFAQVQIDKRRPAKAKSDVYVENAFGSVEVVGWDKEEVAVTGTLAAGAEGIQFDSEGAEFYVGVEVPDDWFYASGDDSEYHTNLVVHVPRNSSAGIETVNASIEVSEVNGVIRIETINGAITIAGNPRLVDVESMTGDVVARAQAAEMEVETVSGAVSLSGVARGVSVETVSGSIEVRGEQLVEVNLETTAGDVRLEGSLAEVGEIDVESFSGKVELLLPGDVKARFECVTFGGQIQNAIGPKPRRRGQFTPFTELKFSTGLNEFDVSVETYSGDIDLQTRSAP
jgi:hypothetical protein